MHKSICTIDAPEFINLQPMDINPLMSKCEIKLFYLGKNRNKSNINKESALKIAKTVRGAPIVGCYKKDKEDFTDHGEVVTIDGDGVHFSCETRPYGFVSPDAKVWFKTFEEEDEDGQIINREYMMTTGYLWTEQFPECKSVIEGMGKQQSMELDKDSVDGYWATDYESQVEFFIINDAIFSKACILGDVVEPCFEGSKITKPTISRNFELDNGFKTTLFSMMSDLEKVLQGGQTMELEKNSLAQDNTEEKPSTEFEKTVEPEVDNVAETEFASKNKEEEEKKEEDSSEEKSDSASVEESEEDDEEKKKFQKCEKDDDEDKKANHSLKDEDKDFSLTINSLEEEIATLKAQLETLTTDFALLQEENASLRSFKTEEENKKKQELIDSFFMLDHEDKKQFIENKEQYSYAEIKGALSSICYDRQLSFAVADNSTSAETNFVVDDIQEEPSNSMLSDWVKAVVAYQNI